MYTQSLSGLGKKDRGGRAGSRKKSSGEATAEKMDVDTEAESTPKSKSTELDPIQDAEVKDEELDGHKSLEAAGREKEEEEEHEGEQGRPPPPSVVVTQEEDVEMDEEHSVDGDKPQADDEDDDDEEEGSDEEEADVTRCVCGITGQSRVFLFSLRSSFSLPLPLELTPSYYPFPSTESDDMMIQCDTCNVWQHGACVGIPTEEETPDGKLSLPLERFELIRSVPSPSRARTDVFSCSLGSSEYFCEKCRPDLHVALKKWMRSTSRGRGG